MKKLKIALLQILPSVNMELNLKKGIDFCYKGKDLGADIILFPEMWNNGYNIYDRNIEDIKLDAIDIESDFVNQFKNLSKQLNVAIGITYLENYKNMLRNTITLFDRNGNEKLTYSKIHTCDFGEERILTKGNDFYVCDLDTDCGIIKVGSMICYDREFPESARILMLKGAELILVPNACPMEINRLSQLRGRAYENMLAIATCNYPSPHPDCNGGSTIFDGVAYFEGYSGSRDTCIIQASDSEGIFIGELDLDMLREYRANEVHGNAYRVPKKYGILLDDQIQEPFIRLDKKD